SRHSFSSWRQSSRAPSPIASQSAHSAPRTIATCHRLFKKNAPIAIASKYSTRIRGSIFMVGREKRKARALGGREERPERASLEARVTFVSSRSRTAVGSAVHHARSALLVVPLVERLGDE